MNGAGRRSATVGDVMQQHFDGSDYSSSADESNFLLGTRGRAASPARPYHRVAALSISFACCAAWALVASSATDSLRGPAGITVRALLAGREMRDIATNNLLEVSGDAVGPNDRAFVRAQVARGLWNITHWPSLQSKLDAVAISRGQKIALLHVAGRLSDSRVQRLGYEIAQTVDEGENDSREGLARRLVQNFQPRLPELRGLRDEIIPAALREFAGERWHTTGKLEEMRIFRSFPRSRKINSNMSGHEAARRLGRGESASGDISVVELHAHERLYMLPIVEKALGIFGGVLEQGIVVLDQTNVLGDAFYNNPGIPSWTKSLVGGLDFAAELGDCVTRADDSQIELYMCPMKYASACFDFLSSLDAIFGMDSENVFGASI